MDGQVFHVDGPQHALFLTFTKVTRPTNDVNSPRWTRWATIRI